MGSSETSDLCRKGTKLFRGHGSMTSNGWPRRNLVERIGHEGPAKERDGSIRACFDRGHRLQHPAQAPATGQDVAGLVAAVEFRVVQGHGIVVFLSWAVKCKGLLSSGTDLNF